MKSSNAPVVLLPYQQQWLADNSQVKVFEKSRRIGATWCEAADNVLFAAKRDNPQDVWFISYSEDAAREYIRDAATWTKHYFHIVAEINEVIVKDIDKDIKAFRIDYASGKRITALSSRPTNLRGKQGVVVLDEFGFHDDPQGLLKAAIALLMWGGKVRILSTHNGVNCYFYELIEEIRKGKMPYSLHSITIDKALEQGLYERICLKTGVNWSQEGQNKWKAELVASYGENADEELFCIPRESGGCYFPRLLVEQNMNADIPVLKLAFKSSFTMQSDENRRVTVEDWLVRNLAPVLTTLNPFYRTSYGFDFGRTGDLSYLVVFQEQPDLVRRSLFALELRNVPFKQQEQILFWIGDRLPRLIGGAHDARGNGQYLAEVAAQRWGKYRIEEVMLSLHWYRENFPKYKAAHEDRQVILPRDSDLLDDHRMVEVIQGVPQVPDRRTKGTDGGARHGDGVIACCLAWFASLKDEHGQPAIPSMEFYNW